MGAQGVRKGELSLRHLACRRGIAEAYCGCSDLLQLTVQAAGYTADFHKTYAKRQVTATSYTAHLQYFASFGIFRLSRRKAPSRRSRSHRRELLVP